MIWGRTHDESPAGRWWYAWHPVRLEDGRWAWCQLVYRRTRSSYGDSWYEYLTREP